MSSFGTTVMTFWCGGSHQGKSLKRSRSGGQASDGNLSTHARKLEDAGYIVCKKKFNARIPKTEFSLTSKGRRVFARHLEHLETLIKAAKGI